MMKEILLTEDEIKQLLRGTLVWSDIAYKLNTATGTRSPVRAAEPPSTLSPSVTEEVSPDQRTLRADSDFSDGAALPEPENYERTSSLLTGKKVIVLLSGAGIAVVGLWLYFFIG